MKTASITLLLIIFYFGCRGQANNQPVNCELLHQTFSNDAFIKLFKVDTAYTGTIEIVDKDNYFKDCNGVQFSNHQNSFVVSSKIPEPNNKYYTCLGVIKDSDHKGQYFVFMADYHARFFVTVNYILVNRKWVIDHFDSGPTSIFEETTPEMEKATEEANKSLHEH